MFCKPCSLFSLIELLLFFSMGELSLHYLDFQGKVHQNFAM